MSNIKLKKAVSKRKTISYEVRPSLHAKKCDGCGKIFNMKSSNQPVAGYLSGIFDKCAIDKNGRGLGNMFFADVCSFKCAESVRKGKWKKIEEYEPFVKEKAILESCSVTINNRLMTEEELVSEWKTIERDSPHVSHFISEYLITPQPNHWGITPDKPEHKFEDALHLLDGDFDKLCDAWERWSQLKDFEINGK